MLQVLHISCRQSEGGEQGASGSPICCECRKQYAGVCHLWSSAHLVHGLRVGNAQVQQKTEEGEKAKETKEKTEKARENAEGKRKSPHAAEGRPECHWRNQGNHTWNWKAKVNKRAWLCGRVRNARVVLVSPTMRLRTEYVITNKGT